MAKKEKTLSRTAHDARYGRLFSNPVVVAQLLEEFLPKPLVAELKLEQLVSLTAKFHTDTLNHRESDKIWRIPRHDGRDAYLALLLEFQSTTDRYMAVRINTYASLVMEQMIKEDRLMPNGEVPPVLPVVLYNGDHRWHAKLSTKELIGLPTNSPCWECQPSIRYYLLDVGAFSKVDLATRTGLPALWFRMENAQDQAELASAAKAAFDLIALHPEFASLRKVFIEFLGTAMAPKNPEFQIPAGWLEDNTMLLTRVEEWKQEWLQEGREEGREEGRQEGEARLLLRLLERKFGTLPGWVNDRLAGATTTMLEEWSIRVLHAASVEAVFDETMS